MSGAEGGRREEPFDLCIVGAGLSALAFLRAGGARGRTLLMDYRSELGGALRPALPLPGLEAAEDLIDAPLPGGEVRTVFQATAVGLLPAWGESDPHTVVMRTRIGTEQVRARRVLIASGGLEVTREEQQIPGSRPAGVMTPAFVYAMLSLGYLPCRRAVVFGSSRYGIGTAERLAAAGVEVRLVPPRRGAIPEVGADVAVQESGEPVEVIGFPRLEAVRFRRANGIDEIEVDGFVYAGGMVANTLWLKGSGIEGGRDGIAVDGRYRTSLPRVFAVGTAVWPSLDHLDSMRTGQEAAHTVWEEER